MLAAATFTTAAAAAAELPRNLRPSAQTGSGVTIWSERCLAQGPSADAVDASDARQPQPDPHVLATLAAALRDGDLRRRGVQVVETAGGPMLRVAGRRPGESDTYFDASAMSPSAPSTSDAQAAPARPPHGTSPCRIGRVLQPARAGVDTLADVPFAAAPPRAGGTARAVASAPPWNGMAPLRVFIVEDSPVIRQNLAGALEEMAPVRVVGFADGAAAAQAALGETPPPCDLAIVDIILREGTGLEVLRALRDRASPVTRVVLTDYALPEIRAQCLALGADRVFDKSADIEALVDVLQRSRASKPRRPARPERGAPDGATGSARSSVRRQ